jgi:hypothetical protein
MFRKTVAALSALGLVATVALLAYVVVVLGGELRRLWWAPLVYSLPIVFFILAFATSSGRVRSRTAVAAALLCILPFMVFCALSGMSGLVAFLLLAAFLALWLLSLRAPSNPSLQPTVSPSAPLPSQAPPARRG